MVDVLDGAAAAFKAAHKRPVVLVIDGAENIAKSSRRLAIKLVAQAEARAACCQHHHPSHSMRIPHAASGLPVPAPMCTQ